MQNVALTLDGVVAFGGANPLTPVNARATALYTVIGSAAISLRAHADEQDSGNAEFRSAVLTRMEASKELRDLMRPINQMARALPKAQFPGVRALFRMPPSNGYAKILSRANSFVEEVGPIKSAFVDRGLPADFDEQLADKIAAIVAATNSRTLSRAEQVGGTAGMEDKASEGLAAVVELDSILSYLYRNDAALLAAWKSVRHVQRDPVREPDPSAPGNGTGGSSESGSPALAKATVSEGAPGIVEPRMNGSSDGVLVG